MKPLIEVVAKHTDGSIEAVLKFLITQGMLSYTSVTHAEIYQTYSTLLTQYTIKKEPKANKKAVLDTAIEHNIDRATVYRSIANYKDLI